MIFPRHILFLVLISITAVIADVSPCRSMKQGATQCNPYDISFLKITQLKRGIAALRRRPVTEKTSPTVEKIRVKNGMTLHSLINKYIKREERLYYKEERKEKKPEKPKQVSVEPKPVTIPKAIILSPKHKPAPVPPETAEDNTSSDVQLAEEVIMPAEPMPNQQEKSTAISQSHHVEFATYIVKNGDSLIGIARQFGVETKVLVKLNNLDKNRLLKEGQKIYIPIPQEDVDAIDNATYIVKRGDTLSRIAKHFRVKIGDLKKYNKIRKKSIIHVGQVLVLPLPKKLVELKRIEERKRKAALKKKRERERLARIALKKAKRARFLKISRGLKRKLSVTATAYTSHRSQTDRTPFLAAWNNRIRPGMKIIAVSRDLIYRYGITNGKKVRISGLPGIYTVRDKMNKKWRRRIDIYMGTSRWRALRWGRRRVTLHY